MEQVNHVTKVKSASVSVTEEGLRSLKVTLDV